MKMIAFTACHNTAPKYVLAHWTDDEGNVANVILTLYLADLPGLREAVRLLEQIEAAQPQPAEADAEVA